MKICLVLFALMFIFKSSFSQTNELEAQYLYTQGEDAYSKGQFPECINFCEQAATKLGNTNQKILFLELEGYSSLLEKKCEHSLLSNQNKIDGYIKYYIDLFSTTADKEKVFIVMKFRDNWKNYKLKGCPAKKQLIYDDLNLGLIFGDEKWKGTSYPKIDRVDNGIVKDKTSIPNGFLITAIYMIKTGHNFDKSDCGISDGWVEWGGQRLPTSNISGSSISRLINSRLACLQNQNSDLSQIDISFYGYNPDNKKDNVEYKLSISLNTDNN